MADIVVGVDGSDGAGEALRWAVKEAEVRGWSLAAALTWRYAEQRWPDLGHAHDPDYTEDDARHALDVYVTTAMGDGVDVGQVERLLVNDHAASGLIEASKASELLVVAPRGFGALDGLVMGSVTRRCLHQATCPIAVVRPTTGAAPTEGGRIVVGVDGSKASEAALDWALDEARARGSMLDVVHSLDAPSMPEVTSSSWDSLMAEEQCRVLIDDLLAKADTTGLVQPTARIVVTSRSAAGELIGRSGDADLVVVGSTGAGGFAGLMLGSVAGHVSQHALCPVVVVPVR